MQCGGQVVEREHAVTVNVHLYKQPATGNGTTQRHSVLVVGNTKTPNIHSSPARQLHDA